MAHGHGQAQHLLHLELHSVKDAFHLLSGILAVGDHRGELSSSVQTRSDESGKLLPDDKRQTKLGKTLRRTSIDELPEIINILKGDMSFVGPRPLLTSYLPLYNEEQHKRHNVRPGFTCIAAVKGRNVLPWVERLKLDTYYAEHVSLTLDLWILVNTVLVVLLWKGVPDASESTREPIEIALKRGLSDENK